MYTDAGPDYAGAPAVPLPSWRDPGSDPRRLPVPYAPQLGRYDRGLGFAFAPLVPGAISVGSSLVGDLFGGYDPDKDLPKVQAWAQQVASSGAGICASGRVTKTGASSAPQVGLSEGATVRFSLPDAIQAVAYAPVGREHDPSSAATRKGLYSAVVVPNPELAPFITDDVTLARLAVGVAHGRLDCAVGWHEMPAIEHLRAIMDRWENRPQSVAEAVSQSFPAVVDTVQSTAMQAAEGAQHVVQAGIGGVGIGPLLIGGGILALVVSQMLPPPRR